MRSVDAVRATGSGTVKSSVDDAVARALERLDERRAREQVRVRAVEDAALGVPPAPGQQAEPHRPVRDVRRRQDEPTVLAQQRAHPCEKRLGIAQVLDQVAAEDDVERAWLERQLHRLDVPDEDVLAHLARGLRGVGVALEADHGAAGCDERSCEVAAGAPDVEHALAAPDEREELRVTAVRAAR